MTGIIVIFIAIIGLVAIANRINVAYPIVLVLGGMAIGFIAHLRSPRGVRADSGIRSEVV